MSVVRTLFLLLFAERQVGGTPKLQFHSPTHAHAKQALPETKRIDLHAHLQKSRAYVVPSTTAFLGLDRPLFLSWGVGVKERILISSFPTVPHPSLLINTQAKGGPTAPRPAPRSDLHRDGAPPFLPLSSATLIPQVPPGHISFPCSLPHPPTYPPTHPHNPPI